MSHFHVDWPKFIGVSTGRAGSVYIATVMNRAGISCTHELAYVAQNFSTSAHGVPSPPTWNRAELGEWSAQVVPILALERPKHVWHQVRDPLNVVASLLAFRLFHNPQPHGFQGQYMRSFITLTGEPMRDAVRFTVTWLERCEQVSTAMWRVEDVNVELLVQLGDMLDVEVSEETARRAIQSTSRTKNRKQTPQPLGEKDLPLGDDTRRLLELRRSYGYGR